LIPEEHYQDVGQDEMQDDEDNQDQMVDNQAEDVLVNGQIDGLTEDQLMERILNQYQLSANQ